MLNGMHTSTMILKDKEELTQIFPYAVEISRATIETGGVQIDSLIPEEIPQVPGWGKNQGEYVIGYGDEPENTVYLAASGGTTRDIHKSLRLTEERATEIRDFMLTLPEARDDWGVILINTNI